MKKKCCKNCLNLEQAPGLQYYCPLMEGLNGHNTKNTMAFAYSRDTNTFLQILDIEKFYCAMFK